MNVTNENAYRLCRGYDVPIVLEKFFQKNDCPLNKEQRRILDDYWECVPNKLDLYRNVDRKNNFKNIGYRLTLPLAFIFELLITFIYIPIRWLFTGKKYINGKLDKFLQGWYDKIFYNK